MTTSHEACSHEATPQARQSCRLMRRLVASAERHELEVEWVAPDVDRSYIVQMWIKNPQRGIYSTKMLVTGGRGTPSVTVFNLTNNEDVSWRRAFSWLSVIAI